MNDVMTPEWSQEAAEILNAPYFSDVDESLTGQPFLDAIDRLNEEHAAFRDAAIQVPTPDKLSPDMNRIYEAARESIVNDDAQDQFFDRIYDEPISYTFVTPSAGVEFSAADRDVSGDADPGEEHPDNLMAKPIGELTPPELQKIQLMLVAELTESGRGDAASVLAQMSVEEFRTALAGQTSANETLG
jgi:hypothetical protein